MDLNLDEQWSETNTSSLIDDSRQSLEGSYYGMEPDKMVLVVALSIFFLSFISSLIAFNCMKSVVLSVKNKVWRNQLTSILNCFFGGILMGTVFLYMIPDSRHYYEFIISRDDGNLLLKTNATSAAAIQNGAVVANYELMITGAFFLIHLLDAIVNSCSENNVRKSRHTYKKLLSSFDSDSDDEESKVPKEHKETVIKSSEVRWFKSVLLGVAMAIYFAFQGRSISQNIINMKSWAISATVLIHQIILACIVSMRMAQGVHKCCIWFWLLVGLALAGPIGMLINFRLSPHIALTMSSWQHFTLLSFDVVAVASTLYVTFCGILAPEYLRQYISPFPAWMVTAAGAIEVVLMNVASGRV